MAPGERLATRWEALASELDRCWAAPPGPEDLRALAEARAEEERRQRLEPERALEALPDRLGLTDLQRLWPGKTWRAGIVLFLEGGGPEDQADLERLGFGPVERFDR